MNNSTTKQTPGFSLALTMLLSVVILGLLFGVYRVITALYINAQESYYLKLAEEAGEAGTAYANACLDVNNRMQTWSSASGGVGPLVPSSDCKGTANVHPANKFVLRDGNLRTTFSVGNLDYRREGVAQISAVGTTYVVNSGGAVLKTYNTTVKKYISWVLDYQGEKSTSGTFRTCAIITGDVWCWGRNRFGQLGNGRSEGKLDKNGKFESASEGFDSDIPVKVRKDVGVLAGKQVKDIFTAQYHSCALAEGKVYCWGYNHRGQLGNGRSGPLEHSNVPVEVKGILAGKTVTAIGGTGDMSFAIAGGKIYGWGANFKGGLGVGPTTPDRYTVPTELGFNRGGYSLPTNYIATALSSSGSRSYTMCAIANGAAYCWGQGKTGQLGDPTQKIKSVTVPILVHGIPGTVVSVTQDGYPDVVADTAQHVHACALTSAGKVYCWGSNGHGQLGINSKSPAFSFVPREISRAKIPAGDTIKSIAAGVFHTCLLTSGKKVYCWGINSRGQIGNGTGGWGTPDILVPTPVTVGANGLPADRTVEAIGAGANRGCAVLSDGRTFCWGQNDGGQIGDGTKIDRYTPVESLFLRPAKNRYIY